jgi:RimJ/RimL family protein N-acetyltransferase
MKYILTTERLVLREFTEEDDLFIIELVNTEDWLKYIGDKNIKTRQQAKEYLVKGPIKSYQENGYGLFLVELKDSKIPIGMCGIINRPTLENPDIGFAFLPQYVGQGFGYEIAQSTINYAQNELRINKVLAITIPENLASIKLLTKLGLKFQKSIKFSNDSAELMLYST